MTCEKTIRKLLLVVVSALLLMTTTISTYAVDNVIEEDSIENEKILQNLDSKVSTKGQNGYGIVAYDFNASLDEVSTKADVVRLANFRVYEIRNDEVIIRDDLLDHVDVSPFPLKEGANDIHFQFKLGNIVLNAYKKATITYSGVKLTTKDNIISLETAKVINEKQLLDLVVESVSHTNPNVDVADIKLSVNNDAIKKLNAHTSSNISGVEVEVLGKHSISEVISKSKVYVFDAVNPTAKEAMIASNFNISLKEISKEAYFKKSNVKLYDISDLSNITLKPTTDISLISPLASSKGIYPTTFESKLGTSVTVNTQVFDNGGESEDGLELMYANNIELNILDVSKANIKSKANLLAMSKVNDTLTVIDNKDIKILEALPKTLGNHTVTFVSPLGNKLEINVKVVGNLKMFAKDINLDKADFYKLRDSKKLEAIILERSQAYVKLLETNEVYSNISVDTETLNNLEVDYGEEYVVTLKHNANKTNDEVIGNITLKINPNKVDKPNKPTNPSTGINNNMYLYVALISASTLTLIRLRKLSKQK